MDRDVHRSHVLKELVFQGFFAANSLLGDPLDHIGNKVSRVVDVLFAIVLERHDSMERSGRYVV